MKTLIKNQNDQQKAFFIPIFIHLHQLWTNKSWLTSKAMKNQKEKNEHRQATKSNKVQQKAKRNTVVEKNRRGNQKPKRATKSEDFDPWGWTGVCTLVVPSFSTKVIKNSHQNLLV